MRELELATNLLLNLHIAAGMVGLVTGAAALLSRKGFRTHHRLGSVFCLAMLCMTASSVFMALVRDEPDNVVVGALTFYLVATGWLTVIRKAGQTGLSEAVALVGALAIVATASRYGLQATQSATGLRGGVTAGTFYGLAAIASSFAAFDVKAIVRGGVSGAQRISRHLWRLGFALFIATLSLFVGQQQVFPEQLRESSVLVAPVVLVAALIVFWLLNVRFPMWLGRWPRRSHEMKREVAMLSSIVITSLPE